MTDPLSEVLRSVKLTGAVFLTMTVRAPWCVLTENAPLRRMMPWVEHLIHFHYVQEGQCTASVADSTEHMVVRAGEFLIFAQGDAHELSSAPHLAPTPITAILPRNGGGPLKHVDHGGTGDATVVVCGFLACDPRLLRPLLEGLPRMLTVSLRSSPSGAWIDATVRQSLIEATSGREGAAAVLSRLAELLFVEALRHHVETSEPTSAGWLAALSDPLVGRAIAVMHQRPECAWTVQTLAREAGCSRSVLAERFTYLLGLSPMRYLARWRMAVAAGRLRSEEGARLARVAEGVGYASETAFNRAFKREYGHSPQRWRRQFAA